MKYLSLLLFIGFTSGQRYDPQTGNLLDLFKPSGLKIISGINFSNIKYINPKDSITSYQSGYNIGFETNFNNLYGGLTFQQRGSKMEFEKTQKFEIKYNYISFHLLLPTIKISSNTSLLLGLQNGFFISGEKSIENNYEDALYSLDANSYNNDLGILLGINYIYVKRINLRASYFLGFEEVKKKELEDNWRNNTLSFSVIISIWYDN